jgi:transposase-like protein
MFPIYGAKCLSSKSVHSWVEKFSQRRSKVADDARRGAEVDETTVKIPMLRVSTHW